MIEIFNEAMELESSRSTNESTTPIAQIVNQWETEQFVMELHDPFTITLCQRLLGLYHDHAYNLSIEEMKRTLKVLKKRINKLIREAEHKRRREERSKQKEVTEDVTNKQNTAMDEWVSHYLKKPSQSKTSRKTEVEESTCSDECVEIETDMSCIKMEPGLIQDMMSGPELPLKTCVTDGFKSEQKHIRAIAGELNEAEESIGRGTPLRIKEELEDTDLDIGPTVLQEMDSYFTRTQMNLNDVKQEDSLLYKRLKDRTVDGNWKVSPSVLYSCEHCEQKFHSKTKLATHVQNMHLSEVYKCSVCEKDFESQQNLSKHTEEVHVNGDRENHKCEKCFKVFTTKNNLWHHRTTVHAKELHKCTKCNKQFKCKAYLLKHIRHTHSEEQHECKFCKKLLKSKIRLSHHVSNYHRYRFADPKDGGYHCDKCTKIFLSKLVLMVHRRQVHATKRYKCEKCNSDFKCKVYMQNHIRKVHRPAV